MKFTKKTIYIGLFSILYLIVAFSSFFHAVSFFGLANNDWMSIILAFAFEVGQAAVLFSLLTSQKDRTRVMPWILMVMFTLVQVIGNIYSSYKYIISNSVENLRYFKEPIFIWTDLPDAQANVIIVYLVGALLPIASLLLTSMITNYLTDQEDNNKQDTLNDQLEYEDRSNQQEIKDLNVLNQNEHKDYPVLKTEKHELEDQKQKKDEEIKKLNQELEHTESQEDIYDNEAQLNKIVKTEAIENNMGEHDDHFLESYKYNNAIDIAGNEINNDMQNKEDESEQLIKHSHFINLK